MGLSSFRRQKGAKKYGGENDLSVEESMSQVMAGHTLLHKIKGTLKNHPYSTLLVNRSLEKFYGLSSKAKINLSENLRIK